MTGFETDMNDVKFSESSFNLSQKQRQDLNEEHRKKLSDYYEKIAIYCASAISFTVTLLGFLFNNKELLPVYRSFFLGYPSIYLIYSGWILLALSLVSSLLSRKMDALYVLSFGQYLYLNKGKDFESKRIDLIKNNMDLELVDISEEELPQWIGNKENLLKKLPAAIKRAKILRMYDA